MTKTNDESFVVLSTANGEVTFRDRRGSWWHDLGKAHRYPSQREANVAAKNIKVAGLGVESYEQAAKRK